jgi:hypothetical protein
MKYARILLLTVLVLAVPASAAPRTQIQLDWNSNADPDVSHYNVYRTLTPETPTGGVALIGTAQVPHYVDPLPVAEGKYYYWISAVDLCGNESELCGPLEVQIGSNPGSGGDPVAWQTFDVFHLDEDQDTLDPYVDRTLDNDSTVNFAWSFETAQVHLYKIYVAVNGAAEELFAEGAQNQFQINTAQPGATYRLRVDACDDNGVVIARGYSDEIQCCNATHPALPGRPEASLP